MVVIKENDDRLILNLNKFTHVMIDSNVFKEPEDNNKT